MTDPEKRLAIRKEVCAQPAYKTNRTTATPLLKSRSECC